ncbi:MAG: glycosyltransferase [Nitrospirota bacterium]|nr:glycosyltransferase [Candidatus Aminicenantes bacterium]MDH5202183.1 glycosyltransferase [Nitrospirota bacterium]
MGTERSNSLIVIPTYNEKENIENLIHLLLEIESKPDILVVDDNSPDGSC